MQDVHVTLSLKDSDYENMCAMAQVMTVAGGGAPVTPDEAFEALLRCYMLVDGVDLVSDMLQAVNSQSLDLDETAE